MTTLDEAPPRAKKAAKTRADDQPKSRRPATRPRGSLITALDIGTTKICCFIARVEDDKPRVLGIGPQIGYIFPIGDNQAFLGLKGYGEFDAANRPSGWNTWLTFSISEAAPASTVTPPKHLVTK